MNTKQYQDATLRTCVERQQKFLDAPTYSYLTKCLKDSMKCGESLDALKKKIFYRKENGLPIGATDIDAVPITLTEDQFDTLHAVMGIVTEGAELISAMLKYLETGVLDKPNFSEELGDVCWYQGMWCGRNGIELENVMDTNIAKLKARYPDKFTDELAENRNIATEREILENMKGL